MKKGDRLLYSRTAVERRRLSGNKAACPLFFYSAWGRSSTQWCSEQMACAGSGAGHGEHCGGGAGGSPGVSPNCTPSFFVSGRGGETGRGPPLRGALTGTAMGCVLGQQPHGLERHAAFSATDG